MPISKYLEQKYGMSNDTKVPTEFLLDELQIKADEVKRLVKSALNRKTYPAWLSFEDFTQVCSSCLE